MFIRIGSSIINVDHIIDIKIYEYSESKSSVAITTTELEGYSNGSLVNTEHEFFLDEAQAVITFFENQVVANDALRVINII